MFYIVVDGGLSQWSKYSNCTKECGGGTQSRARSCSNPKPAFGGKRCNGVLKETRRCNTAECPGKHTFYPKLLTYEKIVHTII